MWKVECSFCGATIKLTKEQMESRIQLADFHILCQECIDCPNREPMDPADLYIQQGQHLHDLSREDTV